MRNSQVAQRIACNSGDVALPRALVLSGRAKLSDQAEEAGRSRPWWIVVESKHGVFVKVY